MRLNVRRSLYPLVFVCKLFKSLIIPTLYTNIVLKDQETYFLFLSRPNIESYKHVKTVHMHDLKFRSKTATQAEGSKIKSLEKRAVAYEKALRKGVGEKERLVVWPTGVRFTCEPRACEVIRLMKL